MTNPIEELAERVTALEHKVRDVQATADSARTDAAAARVLAGGADRDVSAFGAKLDTHKALLEALRETQAEQGQRLTSVEGRLTRLEGKVDQGFSMLATGQAEITALLRNIEAQGGQSDQSWIQDRDPGTTAVGVSCCVRSVGSFRDAPESWRNAAAQV